MSNCPDWLRPFQRETEALAAQNAAFKEETERMRRLSRNRLKQIVKESLHNQPIAPMSESFDRLKQTGRTTRMLKEAYSLASEGRAVYVLAHNPNYAFELECKFDNMFGPRESHRLGVKFETPGRLQNFDFQAMQLQGAHPNCRVLVDHYTIESMYARMLQELHRFDAPSDAS